MDNLMILNDLYERLVIETEDGEVIAIIEGEEVSLKEGYQVRLRPRNLEEIPFDDFEEEVEE